MRMVCLILMVLGGPALSNDKATERQGLEIQLGEQTSEEKSETVRTQEGTPLSLRSVDDIFGRVPNLPDITKEPLTLPPVSEPPPRGSVLDVPFEPDRGEEPPPTATASELSVIYTSPNGSTQRPHQVSIVFSLDMVSLGKLSKEPPEIATIDPAIPGVWRWLSTDTLVFEHPDGLPMSTSYQVTVSDKARSLSGETLGAAHRFSFKTDTPTIQRTWPSRHQILKPQPRIALVFDQAVDTAWVVRSTYLQGPRGRISAVLDDQWQDDKNFRRNIGKPKTEQLVVITFPELTVVDGDYRLIIPAGLKGLGGNRATEHPLNVPFRSTRPLAVGNVSGIKYCRSPFNVPFNNQLDRNKFSDDWASVSPTVPNLTVEVHGRSLTFKGDFQPEQVYQFTLSTQIVDMNGSRLSAPQTLSVKLEASPPILASLNRLAVFGRKETPKVAISTLNYGSARVRLYRLKPEEWHVYRAFNFQLGRGNEEEPPGTLIHDTELSCDVALEQQCDQILDLSPWFEESNDPILVWAQPQSPQAIPVKYRNDLPDRAGLVTFSDLAIDVMVGRDLLYVWTNHLKTGQPLSAELSLYDHRGKRLATARSDAKGVAIFDRPDDGEHHFIIGRYGDQVSILPEKKDYFSWKKIYIAEHNYRLYTTNDRGLYRPGETVNIKGWLRDQMPQMPFFPKLPDLRQVNYEVFDAFRKKIANGTLELNDLGGFHLSFSLPDDHPLGTSDVRFTIPDTGALLGQNGFETKEFRTPEYEVSVSSSAPTHIVGEKGYAEIQASYYSGGELSEAPVNWTVVSSPGYFRPPGNPDYHFGPWTYYWRDNNEDRTEFNLQGHTDSQGSHRLSLDYVAGKPRPYNVAIHGEVQDINQQAHSTSTSQLVHPADLYVGVRSEGRYLNEGEPLNFDVIVSDLEGQLVAGHNVLVQLIRKEWKYDNDEWKEVSKILADDTYQSESKALPIEFAPDERGSYVLRAQVTDDQGRLNETEFNVWMGGFFGRRNSEPGVELMPDKEKYAVGDTARILVNSPFEHAEGLLLVEREGAIHQEQFQVKGGSHSLSVPITENMIKRTLVSVSLVGQRKTDDGTIKTELLTTSGFLNVPPDDFWLNCEISSETDVALPGEEVAIDAMVRDAQGQPVKGAELVLIAVDEAILGLSQHEPYNPLAFFYSGASSQVRNYPYREYLPPHEQYKLSFQWLMGNAMLRQDTLSEMMVSSPMAARSFSGGGEEAMALRSNFNPLAAFVADGRTDGSGNWHGTITLPDNLTRYRILVMAATEGQFGFNEGPLTARLPLMARPSAPRFLNSGDQFQLPVVVQNLTDADQEVQVAVRAKGMDLLGSTGRTVTVPAQDRVRLLFPAQAGEPGEASFQVAVMGEEGSDAAQITLPIYTPATKETFATYGHLDEGAVAQAISVPDEVWPGFGGIKVTTASTALTQLADAAFYVRDYAYGCVEQRASRILMFTALGELMPQFDPDWDQERVNSAVAKELKALNEMQASDGGFGFWNRYEKSWPFLSAHVAHVLIRARNAGHPLPDQLLERNLGYLYQLDERLDEDYGSRASATCLAYGAYVLNLAGQDTSEWIDLVLDLVKPEELSPGVLGWLLPVADEATASTLIKTIESRLELTAATASFPAQQYGGGYYTLYSRYRGLAVVLASLIETKPDHPLIPKMMAGLMAGRRQGRWANTQENAHAILAMNTYLNTYESEVPNFRAGVWLGDVRTGEAHFLDRETVQRQIHMPMNWLAGKGEMPLTLGKEGPGRLYYRVALSYAPMSQVVEAANRGFQVKRRYEAINDPEDVWLDEDGNWHIREGALVRVVTDMRVTGQRSHVALAVPLPAGLEVVDPSFNQVVDPGLRRGMRHSHWRWFQHQNLRTERAEAFAYRVNRGNYEYAFIARATTRGQFEVPPAYAEEMYNEETFGRSASHRVTVEGGE